MRSAPSARTGSPAPGALAALALLATAAVGAPSAFGGVAPRDPNELKPEDLDPRHFTSDELFRTRWPARHKGELAKCETCGRDMKDHNDGGVDCQDLARPGVRLKKQNARCPVCRHRFAAAPPVRDPRGGLDYDFCRHPRGAYGQACEVWLCPACGYAAFCPEFNRAVDGKTAEFVKTTVTPETVANIRRLVGSRFKFKKFKFEDFTFLGQEDIPEYLKYENAIAIARNRGAGDHAMARLHLGASHAYRRLVNRPFTGSGLDMAIRRIEAMLMGPMGSEEKDALELAETATRLIARANSTGAAALRLRPEEKLYLLLRLSGLHDRLGEPWWSARHLWEARKLLGQAGPARGENDEKARKVCADIIARMKAHLDLELVHRKKAVVFLRKALASGRMPDESRLLSMYLMGELLTRVGQITKAIPWLEAAGRLAGRGRVAEDEGEDDERDMRRKLAVWSKLRLKSPAFFERAAEGEEPKRLAPDPAEKELVDKLAAGVKVELPDPAAAAAGGTPPGAAAGSPEGGKVPVKADAKPASCREQMLRIWKAIGAYAGARGEFPKSIDEVVAAGLITREEAGGFVCVASGHKIYYQPPRAGADAAFVLFHSTPSKCRCKNILMSDGTIAEFGK